MGSASVDEQLQSISEVLDLGTERTDITPDIDDVSFIKIVLFFDLAFEIAVLYDEVLDDLFDATETLFCCFVLGSML